MALVKLEIERFSECRWSIYLLIWVACWFAFQPAAMAQKNVQPKRDLATLRKEIVRLEHEVTEKKSDEKATMNLLGKLDQDIDATTAYLRRLRQDVATAEQRILGQQTQIARSSAEIIRLQEMLKKRLVSFYKYRRRKEVEILLSAESMRQVGVWLRYQKLIAQNDRRAIQSLLANQERLQQNQRQMRAELAIKESNLKEKTAEEQRLLTAKTRRQKILTEIRQDTRALELHLKELVEAQNQIKALIAQNEQQRLTEPMRKLTADATGTQALLRRQRFAELKGKLLWPTQGSIIAHFGRHRHPELNTVTENLGIEIKAPLGAPVICVDDGQVQTITWQRGRGNIIIISHGDGYYTVYTNLSEISVNVSQMVDRGQIIGTVGESGSMSGPILHFQIWKNTQNLNPEEWIA